MTTASVFKTSFRYSLRLLKYDLFKYFASSLFSFITDFLNTNPTERHDCIIELSSSQINKFFSHAQLLINVHLQINYEFPC